MIVTIKRQESNESSPYIQSFRYEGTLDTTVAALLDVLNYTDDLYDTEGNPAPRIRWECSCQQKVCGACAMVINSTPALACNTFLRDLKCDKLVLEPLSKFPVTADLIVDRSVIDENLKKAEVYLGELADLADGDLIHGLLLQQPHKGGGEGGLAHAALTGYGDDLGGVLQQLSRPFGGAAIRQ